VRKVRLTGGEPLLRPDVADIVEAFARERADVDVALTTNGQHLAARLPALVAAGLDRVTVHVDSLRPDRYRALMGDGSVEAVLAAAEAARAELAEVKLNVVVQRGKNDDELHDFLAWSRRSGVQVRFIELMNTGSAATYTEAAFVAGKDIVARVALRGAVERVARRAPSDPAALYAHDGVVFGVIASDTEPFCDACDRLRLTADGRLRGCLYQAGGVPLGAALKSHPSDEPLVALIEAALDDKRSSHPADAPTRVPFSMADIGG
jgi:cyclic pyranopterin phosphate synthase